MKSTKQFAILSIMQLLVTASFIAAQTSSSSLQGVATALPAECPSPLGLGYLTMVNRSVVNGHHRFAQPVTVGCTLVI